MPRNTYSERVNITKYIKHAGKWRFAAVAKRPSGNIHWDYVLIDGIAEHHPEGNHFIEWRDGGDRRRKSVGAVPSQVLAEAHRKRAELDATAAGVELATTTQSSPAPRQVLISDAADRYLRDVKMNKAESTFTHYSHCLSLFRQSLTKATVDAIDRDDMIDFQAYLYKQGLSSRTVKHKTTIAASFLRTVGVTGLLRKGDWPTYTEEDPESYTREELQKFFAVCTPDEYLLFQFFLHSGFRDAEVRHAHWTDLDFGHGTVKVKHKEASSTQSWSFDPKSKRTREVPLPDTLIVLLEEARKKSKSKTDLPITGAFQGSKCPSWWQTLRRISRLLQSNRPSRPIELRRLRELRRGDLRCRSVLRKVLSAQIQSHICHDAPSRRDRCSHCLKVVRSQGSENHYAISFSRSRRGYTEEGQRRDVGIGVFSACRTTGVGARRYLSAVRVKPAESAAVTTVATLMHQPFGPISNHNLWQRNLGDLDI